MIRLRWLYTYSQQLAVAIVFSNPIHVSAVFVQYGIGFLACPFMVRNTSSLHSYLLRCEQPIVNVHSHFWESFWLIAHAPCVNQVQQVVLTDAQIL